MADNGPPILKLIQLPDRPGMACTLDAAAQADRLSQWRRLDPFRIDRAVTPGRIMVRYVLDAHQRDRLRELVEAERNCCGFAEFTVRVSGDEVTLLVTGPAGTEELFNFLYEPQIAD